MCTYLIISNGYQRTPPLPTHRWTRDFHGVSRHWGSMGDLIFKSSGVTAIPEIVEWNSFNINDTYLVVCSDGCLSVNLENLEPVTCLFCPLFLGWIQPSKTRPKFSWQRQAAPFVVCRKVCTLIRVPSCIRIVTSHYKDPYQKQLVQ